MKNKTEISVVVCTRNRVSYLKKCLVSLLNQSYLPKEIIVVDDGSDEDFSVYDFLRRNMSKLGCMLSGMFRNVDVIVLKNGESYGVVSSRNAGIEASSGDVVAFLDDDGFAHKDWLRNLARDYDDETVLGAGGPVIEVGREMKTPSKPVKRPAYIRNGKIITKYRIKRLGDTKLLPRTTVPFLQGGNMSFRRGVLIGVKGGDTNITGNCYREETDLSMKVSERGRLLFDPKSITYHKTADVGGCRDVICFNLNRFLFYSFRNTTYFFFKHFDFRRAAAYTIKAAERQLRLLRMRKTGTNRDYLKVSGIWNSMISVAAGSLTGFYRWLRTRKHEIVMLHGKPSSLMCFKLMLIGGSIRIIEVESRTQALRKLFGL